MHHDITAVDVEVTTVSAALQIETLPAAAAAAFAPVSQVSQTSDLRSCRSACLDSEDNPSPTNTPVDAKDAVEAIRKANIDFILKHIGDWGCDTGEKRMTPVPGI